MNIFYVNEDPHIAAISLVDKHVVKMILESAQLLSTAHRYLDGEEYTDKTANNRSIKRWRLEDARENVLYKGTHIGHPSAIWCRESLENYEWLVEHMFGLMAEYTHRYEKNHKVFGELSHSLCSPPYSLRKVEATKMPSCMAPEFIISDDPIINYRNYYNKGKRHIFAYKNRTPPDWLEL